MVPTPDDSEAEATHPDVFDEKYPARQVLELIGDKWTPIVLYALTGGTRRFGELRRQIPDVSKKMLTQTLRRLEEDGLADRAVFPVIPPRVEYTLTASGRKLAEPVAALCEWAKRNQDLLRVIRMRRTKRRG